MPKRSVEKYRSADLDAVLGEVTQSMGQDTERGAG